MPRPVDFPAMTLKLEGQNNELPLPAWKGKAGDGKNLFVTKWKFSLLERLKLLFNGHAWLAVKSGFHPPVFIQVVRPFEETDEPPSKIHKPEKPKIEVVKP